MVDDLRHAVGYHQRVLGFKPVDFHGDAPRSALLRRGDAEILLQQRPAGPAYSHRRHTLWSWDAFVRVPDVARLRSELAARGADIVVVSA